MVPAFQQAASVVRVFDSNATLDCQDVPPTQLTPGQSILCQGTVALVCDVRPQERSTAGRMEKPGGPRLAPVVRRVVLGLLLRNDPAKVDAGELPPFRRLDLPKAAKDTVALVVNAPTVPPEDMPPPAAWLDTPARADSSAAYAPPAGHDPTFACPDCGAIASAPPCPVCGTSPRTGSRVPSTPTLPEREPVPFPVPAAPADAQTPAATFRRVAQLLQDTVRELAVLAGTLQEPPPPEL